MHIYLYGFIDIDTDTITGQRKKDMENMKERKRHGEYIKTTEHGLWKMQTEKNGENNEVIMTKIFSELMKI